MNDEVPDDLGVPEITPEDELSERPSGNCPIAIDHIYGGAPPMTSKVAE